MAPMGLADQASRVLQHGIGGDLDAAEGEAFRALADAIRLRLIGDRRAERVLAELESNPSDERARQALAQELSYYAEVDPDFNRRLASGLRHLRLARSQASGDVRGK